MNLSEINDLDFENIGGWPSSIKLASIALVFVLILVAGYFYQTSGQIDNIKQLKQKEVELKQIFSNKQKKAARLEGYKAQLDEMKIILQSMLRQLPSKTEMPDLLVDISQTALATGIKNELFEPGGEVVKDFYAEKPINLRMIGSYHQFGAFVSGVASLPRVVILTMHDISLKPLEGENMSGDLVLEGTAKTYRYLDDDETDFTSLDGVE